MKGTIQYILILFFAYVYSEENSACGSCDRGKYRSNCTGGNQGVCVPCERCGEGEVRVDCLPWSGKNDEAGRCVPEVWATRTPTCPAASDEVPLGLGGFNFRKVFNHPYDEADFVCNEICSGAGRNDTGQCSGPHACNVHSCVMGMADQRFQGTRVKTAACPVAMEDTAEKATREDWASKQMLELKRGVACVNCDTCGSDGVAYRMAGGRDWGRGCARECSNLECAEDTIWDWTAPVGQKCKSCKDLDNIELCSSNDRDEMRVAGNSVSGNVPFLQFSNCIAKSDGSVPTYGSCSRCEPTTCAEGKRPVNCDSCKTCASRGQVDEVKNGKFYNVSSNGLEEVVLPCQVGKCPTGLYGASRDGVLCVHDCDTQLTCAGHETRVDCVHPHQARCVRDFPVKIDSRTKLERRVAPEANLLEPANAEEQSLQFSFENVLVDTTAFTHYHYQCVYNSDSAGLVDGDKTPAGVLGRFREVDGDDRGERLCRPLYRPLGVDFPALPLQNTVTLDHDNPFRLLVDAPARVAAFGYTGLGYENDPPNQKNIDAPSLPVPDTGNLYLSLDLRNASKARLVIPSAYQQDVLLTFLAADVTLQPPSQAVTTSVDIRKVNIWSWIGKQTWNHAWVYSNVDTSTIGLRLLNISVPQSTVDAWGEHEWSEIVANDTMFEFDSPVFVALDAPAGSSNLEIVVSSRPVHTSAAEKSILETLGLAGAPFVFGTPSSIAKFPPLSVLRYGWPHQLEQNFMLRHAAALDSGTLVLADYYRVVRPGSDAIVEFSRKRRVAAVILFSDRVVALAEHDDYTTHQMNVTTHSTTTGATASFHDDLSMLVAAAAVDPDGTLVATLEETTTVYNGHTVLGLFTRSFETTSVSAPVEVVSNFLSTKTTRSRATAAYFQFCRVVVLAADGASWDAAAACALPDDTDKTLKLHVVAKRGSGTVVAELELPSSTPRSVSFISVAPHGKDKLWVGWQGNVYAFSIVDNRISALNDVILQQTHFVPVRNGFMTMAISQVVSSDSTCGRGYAYANLVQAAGRHDALDSATFGKTRCAAWCSAVSRCGAFEWNLMNDNCTLLESVPSSKRSTKAVVCTKPQTAFLLPEMYSMSSKDAGSDALHAVPAGSLFSAARSSVVGRLTSDKASRGAVVHFVMADAWPQALRMKRLAHYVYKEHKRPMAKPMLDVETPLYFWDRYYSEHSSLGAYPFYLRTEDGGKADAVGLPDAVFSCASFPCVPNPMADALRLEVALACPQGREFSLLLVSVVPGSRAQIHRTAQSSVNLTAPANATSRAEYVLVYHREGRVRVGTGTWYDTDLRATMTLFLGARVDAVVFVDAEPSTSTVAAFAEHKDVRIDKKKTALTETWQLVHRRLSYVDQQRIIEIEFNNPTPATPRAVAVDAVQLLTVLTDPHVERHGEIFAEVKAELYDNKQATVRLTPRHNSATRGGDGVQWRRVHATVYAWADGCSTLDVHVAALDHEGLNRTSFLATTLSRLGCSMAMQENAAEVFGSCDLELPLDAGRLMLRAHGCASVSDLLATVSPGHALYECSAGTYWDFRRKICQACVNVPGLCPVGQYVPGCAALMANASSACVQCDASPEVLAGRANWTGDGCGWVCRAGYWQDGFACAACTSPVCVPGKRLQACTLTADSHCVPCAGGIAANEDWAPDSGECALKCKDGFWRNGNFCRRCSSIAEKRLGIALSGEDGFFRFQRCQPYADTREVRCTGSPNATILADAPATDEDCLISCAYGMRVAEYQHSAANDTASWTLRRCVPCETPLGIDGRDLPSHAFAWKPACAVGCVSPFVLRTPSNRCVLCDGSTCAVGMHPAGPNCSCAPCQRLRTGAHFNFTTHGQVDDPFSCGEKCTGARYDRLGLGECVPYRPVPHCVPGQFLSPRSATNDAICKPCRSCEGARKVSACNSTHDAQCVSCGAAPHNARWNGTDCSAACKPGFQRQSVDAPCETCTDVCAPGTYAPASRRDCYECKECAALPHNATWVSECTWQCADGFVLSASETCIVLFSPSLPVASRAANPHPHVSCARGEMLSSDFDCVPCPGPTPENTTLWEWTTGEPCQWTCIGLAYKTLQQNKSICTTYSTNSRAGPQKPPKFVYCVAVLMYLVISYG